MAYFENIFHGKVTNRGVLSRYFHLSSHLVRGLVKSKTLFGEQAASDHLSSPCGHWAKERGGTGTKPARDREHMAHTGGDRWLWARSLSPDGHVPQGPEGPAGVLVC